MHIVETLMLNSSQQHCKPGLNEASLTCGFSPKAHHGLRALRDTRQHLGAKLGGHFQQQNHQQKAQKWGKCGTKQTVKGHMFRLRAEI